MKKSNLISKTLICVLISLMPYTSAYAVPPQGQNVEITTPVRIENEVFGRANYYDPEGDRESNSTYNWYKIGNPVPIASGTLSKVMLIHFDGTLTSEEGYVPANTSGISFVPGQDGFGQAIEIGQGDVLAYDWPEDCDITSNSGMTIEMWVKPYWNSDDPVILGSANDHQLFYERVDGNNYIDFVHWVRRGNIGEESGHLRLALKDSPGGVSFSRRITWDPQASETWHYVAITLCEGKVIFYVDGQPTREYSYTRTALGSNFYIGSKTGTSKFFKGAIDELRISSRGLSANEINLRFNRAEPFHDQETMLDLTELAFDPGERIVFTYTPQNANGETGSTIRSSPTEIQTFVSSINIDVSGSLASVNKDLLGFEIEYDDHEPGPENEGGEGPYGGAGDFVWNFTNGVPRAMTVDWVKPLHAGLSRCGLWYYPYNPSFQNGGRYLFPPRLEDTQTFIDRMMVFASSQYASMENYANPADAPFLLKMHNGGTDPQPLTLYGYESDPAQAYYDLVDYCNNQNDYEIRYWEFSNEPYADRNSGPITAQYANEYGARMKQADPSIRLVAPLSTETGNDIFSNIDPGIVDDFQCHSYTARVIPVSQINYPDPGYYGEEPDPTFITDMLYPDLVGGSVEAIREDYEYLRNKMKVYLPADYNERKVHVTETNVHNLLNGDDVPDGAPYNHSIYMTAQSWLAAISRASLINMYLRTNLVNSAQLFKFGYSTGPHAFFNRPGQTLPRVPIGNPTVTYLHGQLYADFLGEKLARVNVDTYSFDTPGNPNYSGDPLRPYQNLACLDVLATLTSDSKKLCVIVVNRDISEQGSRDITARINLTGFTPKNEALVRQINVDPLVHNHGWPDILLESVTYGPLHFGYNNQDYCDPSVVPVMEEIIDGVSANFEYTFPAHSITAFEFTKRTGPWPAVRREAE